MLARHAAGDLNQALPLPIPVVGCAAELRSRSWSHTMKHPTPSDFVIDVTEAHVNVTFKPNGCLYCFGRLADPEDIVRFGGLSRGLEAHGGTDTNGDYLEEEVARMAHTLAKKAVTTP
jgi:hypothetical protein